MLDADVLDVVALPNCSMDIFVTLHPECYLPITTDRGEHVVGNMGKHSEVFDLIWLLIYLARQGCGDA